MLKSITFSSESTEENFLHKDFSDFAQIEPGCSCLQKLNSVCKKQEWRCRSAFVFEPFPYFAVAYFLTVEQDCRTVDFRCRPQAECYADKHKNHR